LKTEFQKFDGHLKFATAFNDECTTTRKIIRRTLQKPNNWNVATGIWILQLNLKRRVNVHCDFIFGRMFTRNVLLFTPTTQQYAPWREFFSFAPRVRIFYVSKFKKSAFRRVNRREIPVRLPNTHTVFILFTGRDNLIPLRH